MNCIHTHGVNLATGIYRARCYLTGRTNSWVLVRKEKVSSRRCDSADLNFWMLCSTSKNLCTLSHPFLNFINNRASSGVPQGHCHLFIHPRIQFPPQHQSTIIVRKSLSQANPYSDPSWIKIRLGINHTNFLSFPPLFCYSLLSPTIYLRSFTSLTFK